MSQRPLFARARVIRTFTGLLVALSMSTLMIAEVVDADVQPISQQRRVTAFGTASTPEDFDHDSETIDAPDFELFDDTADAQVYIPEVSATGTASQCSYMDAVSFFFIGSIHGEATNEVEDGFGEGFGGSIFNYSFAVDVPTTFILYGELVATGGGGSNVSLIGTDVIFQYTNNAQGTVPVNEVHPLEPGVTYRIAANTGGFGQAFDDVLTVADGSVWLEAFFSPLVSAADAESPVVSRAFPNPTRESVIFDLSADEAGTNATLSIFDTSGRRVRSLPVSGNHVRWDGLTQSGQRVAPGIYFYSTGPSQKLGGQRLVVID